MLGYVGNLTSSQVDKDNGSGSPGNAGVRIQSTPWAGSRFLLESARCGGDGVQGERPGSRIEGLGPAHHILGKGGVPLVNPWQQLPAGPPYVLPQDARVVEQFNAGAKPHHAIDYDLLPEPFLGRQDAPVVLLNLNPGWSCKDGRWHEREDFQRLNRANLLHQAGAHAFYLLNPAIAAAPGAEWWSRRLGALIVEVGLSGVSENILCVEYFPYHSQKFDGKVAVASQAYSRHLVTEAMGRGALVVGMRGRKLWEAAIRGLAEYQNACWLNSPQAVFVTAKNCSMYAILVCRLGLASAPGAHATRRP